MRYKHSIAVSTSAALALAVLAACGSSGSDPKASNPLGLAQAGKLKVASVTEFLPFEYVKKGKPEGFDIALVNKLAARMNLTPTFEDIEFEGLLASVGNGQYDMGAAAIGITKERKQTVAYSVPYYRADEVIIAKPGSGITDPASLKGKRLAVKAATTDYTYAKKHFKNTDLVVFPENAAALAALSAGRVDAMFIDLPVYQVYAKDHPDIKITYHAPGSSTFYALALPRDHAKLQEEVDKQLTTLLTDGTYTKLYKQYFGAAPSKSVLNKLQTLAKNRSTPAES